MMTLRDTFLTLPCVLATLAIWGEAALAQEPVINREYEIKAACLYNFGRYIEWPAGASKLPADLFAIGVLGKDPFGRDLEKIAKSKTVNGKKIVVRRFQSPDDYEPCHILFVAAAGSTDNEKEHAESRLKAVLAKVKDSPVLLVGETSGAAAEGVALNFYIEENKVKFEANVDALKKARLKVSSRLLQLAKVVKNSQERN